MPLLDQAVLSVSMFDRLGRKFDNFSSIFVEWQLSDFSLGTLQRGLSDDAQDPAQRSVYHRKFFLHINVKVNMFHVFQFLLLYCSYGKADALMR